MLARGSRGVPVDLSAWSLEPKWDGWRCLARIDAGALRPTSRWRNDLTSRFPELGELPDVMAQRRLLLDGELVAMRPDGSQDFHALMARRSSTRLVFVAFDVLYVDGRPLVDAPYSERRRELEALRVRDHHWLTTPAAQDEAATALYGFTLANRWEGVVAKRLDSTYRPASRDGSWLKAKHAHARDLQVDRSMWPARSRVSVGRPLIVYP